MSRELQDEEQRLQLLRTTLEAHIKLAAELHPSELEAHAGSRDPVAAALAARRASLRAVFDSYRQLKSHHIMSASQVMPGDMAGYYGMLESMLKHKDQVKEFQRVAEGEVGDKGGGGRVTRGWLVGVQPLGGVVFEQRL